eukprot:gene1200-1214_t
MKIFRGIFFAILTFSVLAIAIHQNPSTTQRYVTVVGTGTTTVTPDAVRLDASVTSKASTSAAALSNTSKSAQIFRQTLLSSGVLAKYIQTQTLNVTPNYVYSPNGTSKISGYQATQQFTVTIRNAANAGAIVSAAQNAVGNPLQAIAIAKAKATSYASLAGAKIGKILTIDETVQNSGPQPVVMAMAKSDAAATTPAQIDLGTQDVTVTVTTQWSIKGLLSDTLSLRF